MNDLSGFTIPPKKNGSRTRRYIFAAIVILALSLIATHTFLHRTSVGNPRFIPMTFLVYTATLIVVLALLILATILGRNLIKLYFERKSGQLGSSFKTKIVRTFIVLSLLPALLLFRGGRLVARNAGVMDARHIVSWTRGHLAQAA